MNPVRKSTFFGEKAAPTVILKYQGKFKITPLAKINFNMSLITEVPGKQLSFYIEELQELVNASAKNSK